MEIHYLYNEIDLNESASVEELKSIIKIFSNRIGIELVVNGSMARYLQELFNGKKADIVKIPLDIDVDIQNTKYSEEELTNIVNQVIQSFNANYEVVKVSLINDKNFSSIRNVKYNIYDSDKNWFTKLDIFLKRHDNIEILSIDKSNIQVVPKAYQIAGKISILTDSRIAKGELEGRRKDLTELYIYTFYNVKLFNIIEQIKNRRLPLHKIENFKRNKERLELAYKEAVQLGKVIPDKGVTFRKIFNRVLSFIEPIAEQKFKAEDKFIYWDSTQSMWITKGE